MAKNYSAEKKKFVLSYHSSLMDLGHDQQQHPTVNWHMCNIVCFLSSCAYSFNCLGCVVYKMAEKEAKPGGLLNENIHEFDNVSKNNNMEGLKA